MDRFIVNKYAQPLIKTTYANGYHYTLWPQNIVLLYEEAFTHAHLECTCHAKAWCHFINAIKISAAWHRQSKTIKNKLSLMYRLRILRKLVHFLQIFFIMIFIQ